MDVEEFSLQRKGKPVSSSGSGRVPKYYHYFTFCCFWVLGGGGVPIIRKMIFGVYTGVPSSGKIPESAGQDQQPKQVAFNTFVTCSL